MVWDHPFDQSLTSRLRGICRDRGGPGPEIRVKLLRRRTCARGTGGAGSSPGTPPGLYRQPCTGVSYSERDRYIQAAKGTADPQGVDRNRLSGFTGLSRRLFSMGNNFAAIGRLLVIAGIFAGPGRPLSFGGPDPGAGPPSRRYRHQEGEVRFPISLLAPLCS